MKNPYRSQNETDERNRQKWLDRIYPMPKRRGKTKKPKQTSIHKQEES